MLWYLLEAPRGGASNVYPQHMVSWINKKKSYLDNTYYLKLHLMTSDKPSLQSHLLHRNSSFWLKPSFMDLVIQRDKFLYVIV